MKYVIRRAKQAGVWLTDEERRGVPSYTRQLSKARLFDDRTSAMEAADDLGESVETLVSAMDGPMEVSPPENPTLKDSIEHFRAKGHDWVADRMEARECGDCTFCCTAKGIPDMEGGRKPPWVECDHVCEAGCGIYDAKPRTCSIYYCGWRLGLGGESSRPDKAQVMVDLSPITNAVPDIGDVLGVLVHADRPYRIIPVLRMLNDARRVGVPHTGFATAKEDRDGCRIEYEADPKKLEPRIARHAGRGETGWNVPVDPDESEES